MIKKIFLLLALTFMTQLTYAQYEIRHNLTFGLNYTNLRAKKVDEKDVVTNIHSVTTLPDGTDTTIFRPNPQDTYLDFATEGTTNWFVGYKLTLDFNQRYSFDVGLVLNKKGYKTKINTDFWNKNLTWDQFYESTSYFPGSAQQYRYHEEYEVYRLELPFYSKVNLNSFISAYGGFNFSFELASTDENKPLGTRSLTENGNSVVIGQYYTSTGFDADLVVGIDALFGKQVSVFLQGEYGLQSIDANRESGIRFYGIKMGVNYVFKRL